MLIRDETPTMRRPDCREIWQELDQFQLPVVEIAQLPGNAPTGILLFTPISKKTFFMLLLLFLVFLVDVVWGTPAAS